MRHFITVFALGLVLLGSSACGSVAAPRPESQSENTPASTTELTEIFNNSSPTNEGWYFRHPTGWIRVEADPMNQFLYSRERAGDRLFGLGLEPGDMVVQLSYRPDPRSTGAESHIQLLMTELGAEFGEISLTQERIDQVARVEGEAERFHVIIVTRYTTARYVDIIAYARPDEFEQHRPVLEAIIASAEYRLAVE